MIMDCIRGIDLFVFDLKGARWSLEKGQKKALGGGPRLKGQLCYLPAIKERPSYFFYAVTLLMSSHSINVLQTLHLLSCASYCTP